MKRTRNRRTSEEMEGNRTRRTSLHGAADDTMARRVPGERALVIAVIEQAATDARTLAMHGFIRNGHAIADADWPRSASNHNQFKRVSGIANPADARSLVRFWHDGHAQTLADVAWADLCIADIRRAVGL